MADKTETNLDEVAQHTKGLMKDRDLSKGEAAARMANQLDSIETKDILKEL